MRKAVFVFLSVTTIAFTAAAFAQPSNDREWLGVWQAESDGQLSVVLTLADDSGALGGTVVLNRIENENGHARIVAWEPHVLLNAHPDGNALAFQCKRPDGSLIDFKVQRTATGEVSFHCSSCGADAPTVELVRSN